jgi:hypothetical protein
MTDRNEHGFPIHPEIVEMADTRTVEDAARDGVDDGSAIRGLIWAFAAVALCIGIGWAIRWALTAAGVVG